MMIALRNATVSQVFLACPGKPFASAPFGDDPFPCCHSSAKASRQPVLMMRHASTIQLFYYVQSTISFWLCQQKVLGILINLSQKPFISYRSVTVLSSSLWNFHRAGTAVNHETVSFVIAIKGWVWYCFLIQ